MALHGADGGAVPSMMSGRHHGWRDAPGFRVIDAAVLGLLFAALVLGNEFSEHAVAVCAFIAALTITYVDWRGLFS